MGPFGARLSDSPIGLRVWLTAHDARQPALDAQPARRFAARHFSSAGIARFNPLDALDLRDAVRIEGIELGVIALMKPELLRAKWVNWDRLKAARTRDSRPSSVWIGPPATRRSTSSVPSADSSSGSCQTDSAHISIRHATVKR